MIISLVLMYLFLAKCNGIFIPIGIESSFMTVGSQVFVGVFISLFSF